MSNKQNLLPIYPLSYQFSSIMDLFISNKKQIPKEKIYVIGNGWGSYFFVKNLDKNKYEPIIIAPNEKVLNTPKLVNRVLDENAIVEFDNPYCEKIIGELEQIDLENKMLITKSGSKYPYSKVVLSIGSETNDFGISGVNEYTSKFKTIEDADNLRKKLKNSSINSIVYIIGSGITGIELGSKIDSLKLFNLKIIEGMDMILPGFQRKTQIEIATQLCKSRLIDLYLSHMVKSIDKEKIHTHDKKILNNFHFKYDFSKDIIIWTGGVRFNGFNKTSLFHTLNKISPNPIKPRGLEVNKDFSYGKKSTGIFCIGDMVGNMGPPSAQNAKHQAKWLAKYFNNNFDSDWLKQNPYKIESKGKLIHLEDTRYLESGFYTGFISDKKIPKSNEFVDWMIEFFER